MDGCCSEEGSPPVADRLYTQWMVKSMTGELADEIFVVEHEGQLAGMVTLSSEGATANIVLIAVDSSYGGLGLGTALCEAAECWAATRGASRLRVVTQRKNRGACSFYRKRGFTEMGSEHVHHFWRV
jgi:GNAT superfamily N-acetyltransferase